MALTKEQLELALAGHPVGTVGGEDVTELTKFDCDSSHPLCGVVKGTLNSWTLSGHFTDIPEGSSWDLKLKPKKLEGYVIVFKNSRGNLTPKYRSRRNLQKILLDIKHLGFDVIAIFDLSTCEKGHGLELLDNLRGEE